MRTVATTLCTKMTAPCLTTMKRPLSLFGRRVGKPRLQENCLYYSIVNRLTVLSASSHTSR